MCRLDSDKRETLKSLGIFLIGVGIVLGAAAALLVVKFMYKSSEDHYIPLPFSAYCIDGYIKISAVNDDIENVKVIYGENEICKFDKIIKKTSKICNATEYLKNRGIGTFIITSNRGDDIVSCSSGFIWPVEDRIVEY